MPSTVGIVSATNFLHRPMQVSDLILWFDGADPDNDNNPPASGTAVETWVDKASGHNVTQATVSRQPVYTSNQINGKAALVFNNAAAKFYENTSSTVFNGRSNLHAFCALRLTADTGFNQVALLLSNGVGQGLYMQLVDVNNTMRFQYRSPMAAAGGEDFQSPSNAYAANNNYLMQWKRDVAADTATVLSSNAVTASLTPLTQPAQESTTGHLSIGNNHAGPSNNGVTGPMGDFICYAKALNATETGVITGFVKEKWGI